MKNSHGNFQKNKSSTTSFPLFITALSIDIVVLLINENTWNIYFMAISIISILFFIITTYKFQTLNLFVSIAYGLIVASCFITVIMSNLDKQNNELKANELKKLTNAEYLINNCELKIVGVNKSFLTAPQNGYLCDDGITYYISQNYVTK